MTTTSTTEHHAPPVAVAVTNPDSSTWERALAAIARIFVIVTCTVVLYTLYRAYMVAQALADALDEFSQSFSGLGL